MNKIKVLHSTGTWLPQTMVWLYEQISNIPTGKINNMVVCYKRKNVDQFPVKNLFSANNENNLFINRVLNKCGIISNISIVEQIIQKEKPVILHSHFGDRGYIDHKIAKKHGIKHIVSFLGYDVGMLPQRDDWKMKYEEMFKIINLVLCRGPAIANMLSDLGCSKDKIIIQRIGVNLEKIKFLPRRIVPHQPIKFLIAGTFREKKGIPYALEALGILQKEFDNFTITLIGNATDQKRDIIEKKKIYNIINKYNLSNKITMTGFVSQNCLFNIAKQCHLFISPSIMASDGDIEGGSPFLITEMAAGGMPVISTTHCDIPYVLGRKNNTLLVKEKDVNGLFLSIYKLLTNPQLFEEIAVDNRKFIEDNLDVKLRSAELSDIYQQILKK
ncbi:MAG: colanic acid biosynthesis glycosyltransferase WcaL [Cytophagales bacterium]|nr:colanic acid biosynthesis glycosyltransferase WcaL [Cytophagales bacterium]